MMDCWNGKQRTRSNTANFIVERSIDGQNYQPVGLWLLLMLLAYIAIILPTLILHHLKLLIVYYRLKQVDMGGNYTYSEIVTLAIDKKKGIYFSLSKSCIEEMNLRVYTPQKEKLQWQLVDNNGRLIQHGNMSFPLELPSFRKILVV